MKTTAVLVMLGALDGLLAGGASQAIAKSAKYEPRIEPKNFRAVVDHPYFPHVPGTTFKFVEKLGKTTSEIEVAVTHEAKTVMSVSCVVVVEKVWEKGRLTQESSSWYAQDEQGSVWNFGEEAKEFLDRGRVSTEGSWEAGVGGAQPGIVMPGDLSPREPYRQGYQAGVAEDMAQVAAVGDSVTVPFGSFGGCLKTKEWSMLEPGTDKKWYAKGVGLVRAESAAKEITTLISVSRP